MKALKYLGGKVHLARLTHPGGAVCLTSLKGTKVSSVKCSDKSSFVHSFAPAKHVFSLFLSRFVNQNALMSLLHFLTLHICTC